jgi:hypothetical protein
MTAATFLALLGALLGVDLLGRLLVMRRAARAQANHAGELASHRHLLRALDARETAREASRSARADALLSALDVARGRSCSCVPVAVEVEPCEALLAIVSCDAGARRPDEVRRVVAQAVAEEPRAIGLLVFSTDPRAAWRPMRVTPPGETPRPIVFVTTWGAA